MESINRIKPTQMTVFLLALILLMTSFSGVCSARDEIKVMVAPFENDTETRMKLEVQGWEKLVRLLEVLRYFSIVRENRMMAFLKEIASTQDDPDVEYDNPLTAAAKKLGVDYVLAGRMVDVEYVAENILTTSTEGKQEVIGRKATATVSVDLRVIEVQKDRTIHYHAVKGVITDEVMGRDQLKSATTLLPLALARAVENLWIPLQNDFPLSGIVIRKDKKKGDYLVYVDFGYEFGIEKNRQLSFYKKGDKIIHPVTGKELNSGKGDLIARGRVFEVYEEFSIVRMSRADYKALEIGMIVEASQLKSPHGMAAN